MKILVIFIAAAAAASAARPPYLYDSDYHDEPRYFESPPPPPPPPSRSSFHGSYKRYESFPRNFQPFLDESPILSKRPPTADYREREIFFDAAAPSSPYFSRHQPQFYKDALSRFREGNDISLEYKGPPPPAPSDLPQKQTSPEVDGRPNDLPELQKTMAYHEPRGQQPTATMGPRQPLSFGGHSNHLNFGNHGLGFASVAAVTSTDINPLAVTEITATTRAAGASTISMHSASTSPHQISRQQLATNPPSTESPTSASLRPTPSPKITVAASTGSSSNTASTSNNLVKATTPSAMSTMLRVSSESEMKIAQNTPNQEHSSTIMHQEAPKMTYDYMSVLQEFPPAAHGQLPIESYRPMIVPDVKQNLLVYEVKGNFPFTQQQGSSNNVAPVRFSIPTVSIPTTSSLATVGAPVKLEIQGMNFMQTPLALAAAHANNAAVPVQGAGMTQYAQTQQLPIFYTLQNQAQAKPATTANGNIPLGSFYLVPNSNEQVKQPTQHIAPGGLHSPELQLQLGNGFSGIEYLTAYSNSAPARSTVIENGKISLNLDNIQSSEPTYTNVGLGHGLW